MHCFLPQPGHSVWRQNEKHAENDCKKRLAFNKIIKIDAFREILSDSEVGKQEIQQRDWPKYWKRLTLWQNRGQDSLSLA